MKLSNKVSIIILLISVATIAFSLYYYNEKYYVNATNNQTIKKVKKEQTVKEDISEKNIEVKTELKEDKYLVIKIKNITNKDLLDVLLEANYNNIKLSDFYIENIKKDEEKIIELDINKKSLTESIVNLYNLNKNYILIENFDFNFKNIKGKIVVSSFKDQKMDDYKKLINESDINKEIKDKILNEISNKIDKSTIDKLLSENNVYSKIILNPETIVFGNDKKLVVNNIEQPVESTQDSNQKDNVENNNVNNNVNITPTAPAVPAAPAAAPNVPNTNIPLNPEPNNNNQPVVSENTVVNSGENNTGN